MDSTNQNRLDIPASERSEKNSDGQNTRSASLKSPTFLALIFFISILLIGFGTYASLLDARFQGEKKVQAEERAAQMKARILEDQKRIEEKRARALQQPAVTYPANPQPQEEVLPFVEAPAGYCAGTSLMPLFGENSAQCCPGLQLVDGYHCSLPLNVHPPQSPCIDSDSGITTGVWGTVSGGIYESQAYDHGLFTDYCIPSTNTLIEFYCSNTEILLSQQPCLQGTVCRYGACVQSN